MQYFTGGFTAIVSLFRRNIPLVTPRVQGSSIKIRFVPQLFHLGESYDMLLHVMLVHYTWGPGPRTVARVMLYIDLLHLGPQSPNSHSRSPNGSIFSYEKINISWGTRYKLLQVWGNIRPICFCPLMTHYQWRLSMKGEVNIFHSASVPQQS